MRSDTAVESGKPVYQSETGQKDRKNIDNETIKAIIGKHKGEKKALISILLEIKEEYNYLPKVALVLVSEKLGIPYIQVYSVATYYKAFSLNPRGEHLITVCLGTACHVRGGGVLQICSRRGCKGHMLDLA